jgi:hypothetical protein
MSKHIVDQTRDRGEGARIREYTRIEREQGSIGPHPSSAGLQRRPAETGTPGRRTQEFLRRERARRE